MPNGKFFVDERAAEGNYVPVTVFKTAKASEDRE
jgi:hypothetical protein